MTRKNGNSTQNLRARANKQRRKGGKFVKASPKVERDPIVDRTPTIQTTLKPKGTMPMRFFGREILITGGPYLARPEGYVGVKMAREIDAPATFDVPTPDFSVPEVQDLRRAMLGAARRALVGDKIYVGCMAGQGRTGLFLASLYRMGDITDRNPVLAVRSDYYPHAVETQGQERFVMTAVNRDQFRRDLMQALVDAGRVNFSWLADMTWADRILWFRTRYSI